MVLTLIQFTHIDGRRLCRQFNFKRPQNAANLNEQINLVLITGAKNISEKMIEKPSPKS